MQYIGVKNTVDLNEKTTKLTFPLFEIQEGEDDITAVMRIVQKMKGRFKPFKNGSEWCLVDTNPTLNLLVADLNNL